MSDDVAELVVPDDDVARMFWSLAPSLRPVRDELRDLFGGIAKYLTGILACAPVLEAHGEFQLHPDPRAASDKAMRWIFAVRDGYGSPHRACLFGDMVDLVAVDRVMRRPTSRLLCRSRVLGYPQDPTFADAPVRVFATVGGWIRGGFDGVVLTGAPWEQQSYLRDCRKGIVADDLGHAEALLLKMRREIPELPKLFVAES